ncbi:MAG: metalloregulator ArsR/SmtB family transcription factor [Cyanobacteria bacterium P01_F01_bin.116]
MTQEPVLSGFYVLSDPIRLQIVGLLKDDELSVDEICARLNTAQPRLSIHLKALALAGLVTVQQRGRRHYYKLNKDKLNF